MEIGSTIIPPEEMDEAYNDLVSYINRIAIEKGAENVVLVGIKNDGELILNHIAKLYKLGFPIGFIDPTEQRDDYRTNSINSKGQTKLPDSPDGKHYILIDSVYQTGRTARAAFSTLMSYTRPASVKYIALFNRKRKHEMPIQPDYAPINDEDILLKIPSDFEVKLETRAGHHFLALKHGSNPINYLQSIS